MKFPRRIFNPTRRPAVVLLLRILPNTLADIDPRTGPKSKFLKIVTKDFTTSGINVAWRCNARGLILTISTRLWLFSIGSNDFPGRNFRSLFVACSKVSYVIFPPKEDEMDILEGFSF